MILSALFIFLLSFALVCYSIKKIIYISHKKHLFDEPSEHRKIHLKRTPNLGGVAIFASMMIVSSLFLSFFSIEKLNYIIFSALVLFICGVTDDLVGVDPKKKLFAQAIAGLTLTILADYRFTSFYGLFGLTSMPYLLSILLSTVFIIFLINAFNLIDGIDCLAASIGILNCLVFAFYFYKMHQDGLMAAALAMGGCLAGFLLFNRTPAKIFMGDTGSTFLGFLIALFSIKFIDRDFIAGAGAAHSVQSATGLVFCLIIIPVFDTLRVFFIRILRKQSPLKADRNHIHHLLIDFKWSHLQATGILLTINIILLVPSFIFLRMRTEFFLLVIAALVFSFQFILSFMYSRRIKRMIIQINEGSLPKASHKMLMLDEVQA